MSSNFRHQLLSLSLMVGTAAPLASSSFAEALISSVGGSTSSVEYRIIQLERIFNAHSQLLTQLQQQLSDNQDEIDLLRGQIQESQYQLSKVVERQKQILLQVNNLKDSMQQLPPAPARQSGGVATQVNIPGAIDDAAVSSVAPSQNGDANTDYNTAIALAQDKSRQDDAMVAFYNFIRKYPDSMYQPNANYWLGQLNYNKGKKDNAVFYFASVVKSYPKSPKAPDAMYKVGVIMQEKGDTVKAKAIYQQVIMKYYGTDSAKQAEKRLTAME